MNCFWSVCCRPRDWCSISSSGWTRDRQCYFVTVMGKGVSVEENPLFWVDWSP